MSDIKPPSPSRLRRSDPGYMREYRSRRDEADPGYIATLNARSRDQYDSAKERVRRLRKSYGLHLDQFDAMLASQGNACAICRKKFTRKRVPHVDHRHRDGLVRGLLCQFCNWNLLGLFHEDADLFQRAADYVNDPPAVTVIGTHIVPGAPPVRD